MLAMPLDVADSWIGVRFDDGIVVGLFRGVPFDDASGQVVGTSLGG